MQNSIEWAMAVAGNADRWVPACQGTEVPFTSRSGTRMLYCFNPRQQQHAYVNVNTDVVMTEEEARAALMLY